MADRIRKLAPFSIPVSVGTAISICQALEPLHRNLLAHGDLVPQNVAVLANGDVKLQLTGVWEAYGVSPTAGAMVLPGMAPYLAPEVSTGAMPAPTSDVYALGVILFDLLSGRLPYYGDTPVAIALQHASSPVPSVRSVNPSVPAVLDEIVKKAMAKNPNERYASASELLAHLRLLQDALRFGRSLTWPIKNADRPADAVKVVKGAQPVAPRMSAIRTDEEYAKETRKSRSERDVPVWMTMTIVFLAAVVLSLIGVWMLFNLNRPKLIAVPNIVGLTLDEARSTLAGSKLELRIDARIPNDKVELDHVSAVRPAPGEKVREGARLAVTLSSGSKFVSVPDLRGMTVDKAKTVLNSLNLELDADMIKAQDGSIEVGNVVKSMPPAKTKVERESRVRLVLSAGQGDTATPLPTDKGYLYTLRVGLDDITEPKTVKIEMEDESGTKQIFEEVKNPGDHIELSEVGKGKEATFIIYYDGEEITRVTKKADSQNK